MNTVVQQDAVSLTYMYETSDQYYMKYDNNISTADSEGIAFRHALLSLYRFVLLY